MNKRIIIRISCLIIIMAALCVAQKYASNKIISNEITREEHDIEKLEKIKEIISEAIDNDEEARKWVMYTLGDKEYIKILIGRSTVFNYDTIKYYKTLYNAISDYTLDGSRFESILNISRCNYIRLYLNRNGEIDIKIEDENGHQIKCNHIDLDMKTRDT